MSKQHILIVEDEPEMAAVIRRELEDAGYATAHCADGTSGLKTALEDSFQAVLLDANLPGMSGFDIVRQLRAQRPTLPLMMLTSRDEEIDKVLGLELGADDYLTKPFSPRELVARVRALLRRAANHAQPGADQAELPLIFGSLIIDPYRRAVQIDGTALPLTAIEYDLLYFLARSAGKPFTRDDLMVNVWGYSASGFDSTVTTQLSRLRARIEPDPANPKYILTVRNVGYRFVEPHEL